MSNEVSSAEQNQLVSFSESDIVSQKIICDYMEFGHVKGYLKKVPVEIVVSHQLFLDRCKKRLDQFIDDNKEDYDDYLCGGKGRWSEEDESDPVMIALKSVKFSHCDVLVELYPSALVGLIMEYQLNDMLSDLMCGGREMPSFAYFLMFNAGALYFEEGRRLRVVGEAYELPRRVPAGSGIEAMLPKDSAVASTGGFLIKYFRRLLGRGLGV
jgi:hypothetical protein